MKLKLCNVHKLALSNEGEGRKPIHIPFGTWAYDDTIDQTLDREHAEAIAADLAGKIAAGEPGIPVYQGHPDVPEYAGKYPDKGALGWVKKILVNEDGMDLEVEWDRDPGKGFGWFSPYWTGDDPGPGATGKRNVIVDGLTSIGLVNNPNIREFRLANEAQPEERKTMKPYQLPQRIIDLANEYDESKHPRAEDGKWTSGVGGGGGASEETKGKLQKMLKFDAISVAAGGNPASAPKDAIHFEHRGKKYYVGKDSEHMVKQFEDAGLVKRISGSGGGGSGGATVKKVDPKTTPGYKQEQKMNRDLDAQVAKNRQRNSEFFAKRASYEAKLQSTIRRAGTRLDHANIVNAVFSHYPKDDAAISAAHRTAIYAGLKYNHKLHRYE